jgi:hypothetical protein
MLYTWRTCGAGSGTVNITSINTTTHGISGSFIVNAIADNPATTCTISITDGVYKLSLPVSHVTKAFYQIKPM